jgi:hypothetical protein
MRLIGVKTTKLYDLLNSGRIESRRIGSMRLISYASLMRLGEPERAQQMRDEETEGEDAAWPANGTPARKAGGRRCG